MTSLRLAARLPYPVAIETSVLEAARDAVLVMTADRRLARYNRRFLELSGLTAAELDVLDERDLLAGIAAQVVDPDAFLARVEDLYARPRAASDDLVHLRDGRVIERHSAPVLDAGGAVLGRVWFLRDVTAQHVAAARLREANQLLDAVVENIPSLVFVRDARRGELVRLNRACEEVLGVRREDELGRAAFDFRRHPPLDTADGAREHLVETPARGVRRLRTRSIPICFADDVGGPRYVLGIAEDVTTERAREAELYVSKERAERASRAKSAFLLNMSHELRTPLNAILGFARILCRDGALGDDDRRAYAGDVVRAGEHMLALVNDLLDLRSLEAGEVAIAPVELLPPLTEAIRIVRPLVDERRHALTTVVPAELPPVMAERRAIVQIFINLLSNAAKYTPDGGALRVEAIADAGWIHVEVTDTGCGIAPEGVARLFTYFEQLGAKHDHQLKGSGVGLALTRALVEKMGGTIAVTSEPGRGSTFRVSLRGAR